MFKQIKSIFIWSLLYKFRKRVVIISLLISSILLSQWIYSDVVEYLKLTEKITYLDYILPIKWIYIFSSIGISVYLILTIFKSEKKEKENKSKTQKNEPIKNNKVSKELSEREKSFLKKKLRSEADILMDK